MVDYLPSHYGTEQSPCPNRSRTEIVSSLYTTAYALKPSKSQFNMKEYRSITLGHPIARQLTTEEKVYAATLIWCPNFDIVKISSKFPVKRFTALELCPRKLSATKFWWRRVKTTILSHHQSWITHMNNSRLRLSRVLLTMWYVLHHLCV